MPSADREKSNGKKLGFNPVHLNRCLYVYDGLFDLAVEHIQQKSAINHCIEVSIKQKQNASTKKIVNFKGEGYKFKEYICTQNRKARYKDPGIDKDIFREILKQYLDTVLDINKDCRKIQNAKKRDFDTAFWYLPDENSSAEETEKIKQTNLSELKQIWPRKVNEYKKKDEIVATSFPEGPITSSSPFYFKRENIDLLCQHVIEQPGSLLRIKAPMLMGKTSLLLNLGTYARNIGYDTVYLRMDSANKSTFDDVDIFLKWFCSRINKKLQIETDVESHWKSNIGNSNDKCTDFFEEEVLPVCDSPLLLALDNIERLFTHKELADDFFGMLRGWHETWKDQNDSIWKNIRLILAYSTEEYIPLNVKTSPFNVGTAVELDELNTHQIEQLAQQYQLDIEQDALKELIDMVGGHPYLIQIALYNLQKQNFSHRELINTASTPAGVYDHHLRMLLSSLQRAPGNIYTDLSNTLKQIMISDNPVYVDSKKTYMLHSLGIVKKRGNSVEPRCKLYREYFCRELGA